MVQIQKLPYCGFSPIRFTVNIIPKPQMRSRSRAIPRTTKDGRRVWTAMNHKDPEQERREEQLMEVIERYAPDVPWDCAILLGVKAYLPIPASKASWWQEAATQGFIRPTPTPDSDNLFKNIKDCLTKTCFWKDDSQVVGMTNDSGKYYGVRPRWEIGLYPLWQPKSKKEWEEFKKQTEEKQPRIGGTYGAGYVNPIQKDLFASTTAR